MEQQINSIAGQGGRRGVSNKTLQRIYRSVREGRNVQGVGQIRPKDVAAIIRVKLRAAFPGTTFSVRTQHGTSVNIHWTDGPPERAVESIVSGYSFGGFDGMIDLAYYCKNWLLPNCDIAPAECRGTEGSMGSVPGYATDCPAPGAVLVDGGPKYVFTQRTMTEGLRFGLAEQVAERYGITLDVADWWWQDCNGRSVSALACQLELEQWNESHPGEAVCSF